MRPLRRKKSLRKIEPRDSFESRLLELMKKLEIDRANLEVAIGDMEITRCEDQLHGTRLAIMDLFRAVRGWSQEW